MRRQPSYCLVRAIATALSATPFVCAAQSETAAGIGVSGNVEYATNPFLVDGDNTAAVRGRVSISPFVEERTSRSSLRVSADASFSKYSRRYDDTIDLSTLVGYSNQLTRQLSIRAGASLNSSIGGLNNLNTLFQNPVPGVVLPPVDITIIGSQERTTQVGATAGLTYAINDKNTVSLGSSASVVRYPEASNRNEYSNISQSVSYSRVISPRISGGASVAVSRINYFGTDLGDALIISPSLDANIRLAANWTLTGSVGVSISRVNIPFGTLNSTDLSGGLNLCRTNVRSDFCLNGSRSTAASSFNGIRTTSTIGATYSYRVNARDSISASGGYSRSSVPRQFLGEPTDYLSASTSFSRRFSDRMTGQVSAGFRRSDFRVTRSNAYASIGLNYSFGSR